MPRGRIQAQLKGGDRRSIGRSNQIVSLVLRQPRQFPQLMKCLWSENPVVRMRAADAAEKISSQKPELLRHYKEELLGLLEETTQQEMRWHLAALIPRLPLTEGEIGRAWAALTRYLNDRSSIVKTFALQGLADLARLDPALRESAKNLIEDAARAGTAAMKARARKLLRVMEKAES